MKTHYTIIGLFLLGLIALSSCKTNDDNQLAIATATQFQTRRDAALTNQIQNLTLSVGTTPTTLTATNGVKLTINGSALRKNGAALVAGSTVNVEFIQIADKGHMLVTNKPTMGLMANGNKDILKSGGEFYIKATQDGVELTSTQAMTLLVPTTTVDAAMTLWQGDITDPDNLVWKPVDTLAVAGANLKPGVRGEGTNYYVTFGNFGWTNVDRFRTDTRAKTTIQVSPPAGYDNNNCSIYLSYDGEGTNALAKLDTYSAGIFSEHYGQIPIGLACHIIFATAEANGLWRWAIQGVTISANSTYTFTTQETISGNEAQLVDAVNAIQ